MTFSRGEGVVRNYFSNRAEAFFIKLMSELSHNWPQQNNNTLEEFALDGQLQPKVVVAKVTDS